MAASIKEIMVSSNAYNFFISWYILIKFAANWFAGQFPSFKDHKLYYERFPLTVGEIKKNTIAINWRWL